MLHDKWTSLVAYTNFIVFGLTQPGIKPVIYLIQGREHYPLYHWSGSILSVMIDNDFIARSKSYYYIISAMMVH